MIIEVGSDQYQKLFGFRDFLNEPFTTRLPPHRLLAEALHDPSKSIDAIDAIVGDERPEGVLYSAGLQDITLGSQVLMHARVAASAVGGSLTLPGNGILTNLQDGLAGVMQRIKIVARPTDEQVMMFLADTAFAIGMKALGAIGPVGKIAAAIIGFGRAIYQLIVERKKLQGMKEEDKRARAYALLPPLQEPDSNVDAWYVDSVLRPKMEGGSWTGIFAPRFDSDQWVVAPRNGGYAIAPGNFSPGYDDLGERISVFTPGGGIGLIPGLDQVTSIIQVSTPLTEWSGGKWPIRPEMVQDVGKYFVNTGRLAALAWAWASDVDGGADLYKIHVSDLDHRWRRYCQAGLRYLLDNAKDWNENQGKSRVLSDFKFVAGSAIGCAIGAWRCMPDGNGFRLLTNGLTGDAMKGYGLGREQIGCVMDPPSMNAMASGQSCLYTIYDLHIKDTLGRVAERQVYFLWHSLVAAYVKSSWDGFKDPILKDHLMKARKAMLEHPDRMLVQLADVAADEPGASGSGKTWKQELIASGVKTRPAFVKYGPRLAGGAGTLSPDKKPIPKMPVYTGPMAWGDLAAPEEPPPWSWKHTAAAVGGIAIGAGGVALARWWKERSGRV